MSPRRVRGVCVECVEPARARGRCWTHYRLWRAATPEEQRERIPDGALVAGQVAAMLGITTASLTRRIARGQHRPDGRTSGRSWWWPATVAGWGLHRPSADALVVTEVAARLGVSTSQVHRLAQNRALPAGGRHGGRGAFWWDRAAVEQYERQQPGDVLWTSDLAQRLGVSRETVRRLAQTSLRPDGVHRGRRWWLPSRIDALYPPPQRGSSARRSDGGRPDRSCTSPDA